MKSELSIMYESAKREYEALCEKAREIGSKKADLEKVIAWMETQIRRKGSVERLDRPPLNDVEIIAPPVKRNKMVFMIKVCSSFGSKQFSQQDVVNKLKAEYSTFDITSVPWYLQELTARKTLVYDGLQYQLKSSGRKRGARTSYGFNVSREVEHVVLNELGSDRLAFNVSKVHDRLISKYPTSKVPSGLVGKCLWDLETRKGLLTSQPGSHSKAAKIYSVK